jgi:hypothetical protein
LTNLFSSVAGKEVVEEEFTDLVEAEEDTDDAVVKADKDPSAVDFELEQPNMPNSNIDATNMDLIQTLFIFSPILVENYTFSLPNIFDGSKPLAFSSTSSSFR